MNPYALIAIAAGAILADLLARRGDGGGGGQGGPPDPAPPSPASEGDQAAADVGADVAELRSHLLAAVENAGAAQLERLEALADRLSSVEERLAGDQATRAAELEQIRSALERESDELDRAREPEPDPEPEPVE